MIFGGYGKGKEDLPTSSDFDRTLSRELPGRASRCRSWSRSTRKAPASPGSRMSPSSRTPSAAFSIRRRPSTAAGWVTAAGRRN